MQQVIRTAIRSLAKSPAYVTVVVASLTIGIGACILTFSALEAQWSGVSLPAEERLVRVGESTIESCGNGCADAFDRTILSEWQAAGFRSVGPLAPYEARRLELAQPPLPEPVAATAVGAEFFATLGIHPIAGRLIGASDCAPGAPSVALVGYGFARDVLGGVDRAVGAKLTTSRSAYSVVGVLPRGFAFPEGSKVWVGCSTWSSESERVTRSLFALARLTPGVGPDAARSEIIAVQKTLDTAGADRREGRGVTVTQYARIIANETGTGHLILMAAVWIAFIVACANVANLTLIRAIRREREVAVRYSLGAKPRQIAMLLVAESALLVAVSTVLGFVLAARALSGVSRFAITYFGFDVDLTLNIPIGVATVLLASFVAIACGLAPMAQLGRTDAASLLRAGGGGISQRRGHVRLKSVLVGAQVALVVALGCGALIFVRAYTYTSNFAIDFDIDGVFVASPSVNDATLAQAGGIINVANGLVQRVSAAAGNPAPAVMANYWNEAKSRGSELAEPWITIDGREPMLNRWSAATQVVGATPTLLRVLDVPLVAGRDFTASDMTANSNVAIVNEAAAHGYWPGVDPVGKRFKFGPMDSPNPWITVIGVARGTTLPTGADLAMMNPGVEWKMIYRPMTESRVYTMSVVARADGMRREYISRVRAAVEEVFGARTTTSFATLRELNQGDLPAIRLKARLMVAFGIATLLLGLIGIQALVAESVLQRTREIGIRMALGARSFDVLRSALSSTIAIASAGVVVGCAIVAVAVRVAARLILGIQSRVWTPEEMIGGSITSPRSYLLVLAIVVGVVAITALIPARRALRVDPVRSLRAE